MAQTAQNLVAFPKKSANLWTPEPQNEEEKPWHRLENEPPRWYLRFRIYTLLGPKRSLQAAVAAEKMQPLASKSTEVDETFYSNFFVTVKNKASVDEAKEVAKHTVEVPGSWRQASVRYHWVERSRAYDLAAFEEKRRLLRAAVGYAEFAETAKRIVVLDELASALHAAMYKQEHLSDKELFVYIRHMQGLLRDIAREMKQLEREP